MGSKAQAAIQGFPRWFPELSGPGDVGMDVSGDPVGSPAGLAAGEQDRVSRVGGEHAVKHVVSGGGHGKQDLYRRTFGADCDGTALELRGDVIGFGVGQIAAIPLDQETQSRRFGSIHACDASRRTNKGNQGFPWNPAGSGQARTLVQWRVTGSEF